MSQSESRSKADRNKRLFDAVLDGMGFKEAGEAFGVGQVRARQLFLREIRNAGSEIWDEGVRSGVSGAYAAPPLKWIRDNKERVVAAIESDTWLNERRIRRLMAEPAIAENAGAGKWFRVGDDLNNTSYIVNPAGAEYEISESRLAQLDRDVATLLNDMLEGLIDLQNENEALRSREALHARAEGQSAFDLQAQVEALKAARAADKAGFEVVIRDLREEVARLKGGSQGALLSGVADIAHCGGLASLSDADAITAIRKLTLTHFKKSRRVDQMKRDVLAALRAEGGAK